MGGYPGSNRELTVPHTVALPIELYPPYLAFNIRIPGGVRNIKYEVGRKKNELIKSIANYPANLLLRSQSYLVKRG